MRGGNHILGLRFSVYILEQRYTLRYSRTVDSPKRFFPSANGKLLPCAAFLLAASLSPARANAQGAGYWHVNGSQILDSTGKDVRIAGINWYGFETIDQVVHGLYSQDYHAILNDIHQLGYNTIRLPFSNQMVESSIVPSNISYSNASGPINTDLRGLNSLQIMDKVIQAAGSLGLRVILDNHRSDAGNSAEANGLWYTSSYPEANWIADWKTLVARYSSYKDGSGNPVVVGVDLRNEPHNATSGGACWTGDNNASGCPLSNTAHNWPSAAERAGNAVLSVNPNLLIFVEGVDEYNNDWGWWGGNLEGAQANPVTLTVGSRVAYSAHDYGPTEYQQSWFNSSTTQSSLDSVWTRFWAYLSIDNIAPVWVGEFGTTNTSSDVESNTAGSEGQWFSSLVSFLSNHPSLDWTYWALNGEDRYGLLDSNYDSVPASSLKQQLLSSIQFKVNGGGSTSCTQAPPPPSGLSATAVSSSQVQLHWNTVTSPTDCTSTYNIFRSTSSGFSPSSSNHIAAGLSSASFTDSGLQASTKYFYLVTAGDAAGSSSPSGQAYATTSSAGAGGACQISYRIVNQWNTGFQAAITIHNTGSSALNHWTLTWTFANHQQITNLWNGNESQSGASVTVANASYNGSIPAGGSYSGVGFVANYSEANTPVTAFSINGVPCH
jgi:endoglucanase